MRLNGKKLARLRAAKVMTQEQLAERTRISVRTIQRAEMGASVDAETVAQLAAELGVQQADLMPADIDREHDTGTQTPIAVLTAARSPGAVIELLRQAATCSLDYPGRG